jgi:DNA-binding transcriptional regulator YdaS (Cro superfamily)
MDTTSITTAIKAAGGQVKLAQAIGVSQSLVSLWASGRLVVPIETCPKIELATGVRAEQLRPDVLWGRDADGHLHSYTVRLP